MPIIGNRLTEPVSFPKNQSEWHYFLKAGRSHDHVQKGLKLKRYFDSLPESAALVRPNQIKRNTGIDARTISHDVMHLIGSWQPPDYYGKNARTWVNPNYADRYRYADAGAVCECGAPVLRERFGEKYQQPVDVDDHSDGCCRLWRVEARARMWRKRHDTILEMTGLGHSFRQTNFRLGFMADTDHGSELAQMCGLDPKRLAEEGRAKVARTAIVLLRDYSTDDIAELYGISRSALNSILREETTSSGRALYSYRRRMGKTGSVVADA